MNAIKAAKIYTGTEVLQDSYLIVDQNKIVEVTAKLPSKFNGTIEDLGEKSIAPAFIDLQVYGGGGSMFNTSPTVETIQKTYEQLVAEGTHYFQITLSTVDLFTMLKGIDACRAYLAKGGKGLLGLHLEGPYFNPIKKGAHVEKYIRKPNTGEIQQIIKYGKGIVNYWTVAPEMFNEQTLKVLIDSGIHISLGHSDASFEIAKAAINNGVRLITHLFNAMSPLQGRSPGLVGAAYDSTAMASVVADGVHVSYDAIRISKAIMGDRLFYITDAVTEDLAGEYAFTLNGDHYVDAKGTLAGSALSMRKAVQNGVDHIGISMEESLRMASTYPAKAIGLDHQLGYLKPGYLSEYVVL